jgi:GAF domain-containing protein
LSEEETYLLTALNNRLSQILESARLYEETQARAAREALINRLTSQIARAIDLDGVLRAAAIELAGIPAVREATVALLPREPDQTPVIQTDYKEIDGGGNGHRA